jgi:hypothetical protein
MMTIGLDAMPTVEFVNIAFVVKLRSIIPPSPMQGYRPHSAARPPATPGGYYPEPKQVQRRTAARCA